MHEMRKRNDEGELFYLWRLKVFKFCRIYNSTLLRFCKVVSGHKTKKKRKSANIFFVLKIMGENAALQKKRIEFCR